MKKKNAIMLADTRHALVGVVLLQIQRTNAGLFDEAIIYYTEEYSDKDKELMNSILPCRFVEYNCPIPAFVFDKPRFKLFSPLMFVRYEMPSYLNEFETITWLDTDILIQGDISEMINAAAKTGAVFIREDPVNKTSEKPDKMASCFSKPITGYDLNQYLYCSGTIVLSTKCTSQLDKLTQWCYEKTIEWADYLDLPDQGVLNAAIQEFNIKVTPIAGKEYCCYPYMNRDCSDAKIIHAWGLNKFWNDWYVYKNYDGWKQQYEEWLKLTGSPLPFAIKPEISVVIPTYKPNMDYFKQCIDSLRQQNRNNWERYSDFEIIIVSEPVFEEELSEFVKSYNDERIRLIFNEERLGIAASINVGIKASIGKYILRIDDDDIAAKERLYLQKQFLNENEDVVLCTSDFEYFGDMNERRLSFEGDNAKAWSLLTCPFDHPTIMFRKSFFVDNNLFYDEERGFVEDWELWRRAFKLGMTVGCIHQVLFYHRWINNASAGQNNKTITMMREMISTGFEELNVTIDEQDLEYMGPWNGMVQDMNIQNKIAKYFDEALENNKKLKLYNQNSLEYVFDLRKKEMQTGVLPGLVQTLSKSESEREVQEALNPYRPSFVKRVIKKALSPIYRPFKNRYENKLSFVVEKNLEIEGHVMNCIHKLDSCQSEVVKCQNEVEHDLEVRFQYLNDRMYDLERELKYLKALQHSKIAVEKKIILIGTPEHSNIGDAAITLGEIEFIRKYFSDYRMVELSKYDFNDWHMRIDNLVGEDDIIFLQGGGNMGNRYLPEEELRRFVVEQFPNNKIVIMPQTIYFEDSKEGNSELKISSMIYSRHSKLQMFVRGERSLHIAQTNFGNTKVMPMLDMALMLSIDFGYSRHDVLMCIRNTDDEGIFTDNDYQNIENILMLRGYQVNYTTNTTNNENIYKDMRREVVYKQLKKYAESKFVVTDRLHGLIFSLITKTPCIVLDSYNYKLAEFYKIVSECQWIYYVGSEYAAIDKYIEMIERDDNIVNSLDKSRFKNMAELIRGK